MPPFSASLLLLFFSRHIPDIPQLPEPLPICWSVCTFVLLNLKFNKFLTFLSLSHPEMACIIATCCFNPLSLALLPPYLVIFLSSQIPTAQLIFAVPRSFVFPTLPLYPYLRPSHARHSHLECQKSPSHTITHLVIKQSLLWLFQTAVIDSLSVFFFPFFLLLPSHFLQGSFCCRLEVSFLIRLLAENLHLQRERERRRGELSARSKKVGFFLRLSWPKNERKFSSYLRKRETLIFAWN